MKNLIAIAILMVVANQANASKIKVYKWVDKNGVVTFSEYRPSQDDYVELEIEGDRVVGGKSGKVDYNLSTLGRKQVDDNVVQELNEKANEYCKKAKHNLNVLETFKNVRVLNEAGQPTVLDKKDVMEQRRLAMRQVELFCNE
ncbi:DUF4124 domain-containing protein [Psychrosphaera sp. B3R10]|uniref:DUF4124 domain-containing protein n=1 Tax=unclassified Psychrosphaera TaxID=2641570 RepID=UPI001C09CE59|nr:MULTISPECIES: DUF4124 domain-containing protein [unclassified Psychrosphaera]MBU2884003.1 DUF4124 domain-containing protein [Psychrosphaera sp. I2R16]MBU2988133.1 DUF4124 domain-containing protein [Psychrosphaera sp. B3R10]MDO6718342.1 DUF4124 domain-containing protein [Psychrosphaera sp. 1_MG-2023]